MNNSEFLSIIDVVVRQAEWRADAVAVESPGRDPLTYGALLLQVHKTARTLNAFGVGRNDRVAIVLENGPEMALTFIAVASCSTSAPLNPAYRAEEFDFYLSDLNARALIVEKGVESPARQVALNRGIPIIELTRELNAPAGVFSLEGESGLAASANEWAEPEDVALVLHTSGTTSRPKIVPLTGANICASAGNIKYTLGLGPEDRCLNVMPLFHIHGLIGATLSSLYAGASVVCTSGFHAPDFFRWIEEFHPTWYTAVPTIHQSVLTRAAANHEIIKRNPLRFIRSSSSALPPQVMAELERVFNAPVIESYGMTEASHQMASNPLPPLERKPGSVGLAAGPRVAIMDDAGNLMNARQTGEIVIEGANVTRGYENNPAANQSAFTNGWFRTGDQGYMDEEGYLFITGRIKEIINRGGEKISPREVDEILMEHPAVLQAVTFAVPHPQLGEDVAAAVVLREQASVSAGELRGFASGRLADFKVPRQVLILDEIPKGPTGKLQRIGLASQLGLVSDDSGTVRPQRAYLAPRDDLESKLVTIWESLLKVQPVGIREDFFELGGYSLLAVDLVEKIREELGSNLPVNSLLQAANVEQQAELIRKQSTLDRWSSLVPVQTSGTKLPFFCVAALGVNVIGYRRLAAHLGADQPFYVIEAQGLEGSLPPHSSVEEMAAHYIKEIQTIQPRGPYLLGGESSGGVLAFEMAQQLLAQNEQLDLLALFDTFYPQDMAPNTKARRLIQKIDTHMGNLLALEAKPRNAYIRAQIREMGLKVERKAKRVFWRFSHDTTPNRLRTVLMVREAGTRAIARYTPRLYAGRITLFLATESTDRFIHDRRMKWGECTAEGLDVYLVPGGNHSNILQEPQVKLLADKLKACLNRAQANQSESAREAAATAYSAPNAQ